MDDATRPSEESAEVDSSLSELVGELTHVVLTLFREWGIPLAQRLMDLGRDPFEVLDLFVVTLRALADGLEHPNGDWLAT